ncbi:hypothetical protein LSUE1_G001546, partial [Lachnellula suecica]
MQWLSLVTVALAVSQTHAAMTRFACSQLVTERLDPIISPGVVGSQHMHQIVGGNAFNVTMPETTDFGSEASCTSCTFSEDFSNYWTPVLYFQAQNGSFRRVPQMANQYLNGANGGVTVYYVTPDDTSVNVTAFKPGFRMIVGTATARTSAGGYTNSYRCYDGPNFEPNPFGVSDNDTMDLPQRYCAGGIRAANFFPTCWDGVNLDSPDHKSHMSYLMGSTCPSSHPVQVPQVFLETVWDTAVFDKSQWPTDGSQPFVFAQGDPTGYGNHADYVFGWKGDSLQRAMDARCDVSGCTELATQTMTAANQCTQPQIAKEALDE